MKWVQVVASRAAFTVKSNRRMEIITQRKASQFARFTREQSDSTFKGHEIGWIRDTRNRDEKHVHNFNPETRNKKTTSKT